ncbi:MAG: iron(III) transport system ATP-binding protein [Kiritimatiellia bacterium]|jgi:iron(III) transport system ATP-binding protein
MCKRQLALGTRGGVRNLVAFTLLFLLTACTPESGNTLQVKSTHTFSIPAIDTTFPGPRSITFGPDGMAYVLDNGGRVLTYDRSGACVNRWFMPAYDVGRPEGIEVTRDGQHLTVCDTHYHRILQFALDGTEINRFGSRGTGPSQFEFPVAVTQDDQDFLYIAEYGGNDRIQKFTRSGEHVLTFGSFGTGPGQFQRPSGMVWHDGLIYIADAINNRIQIFTDEGLFHAELQDAEHPWSLRFPYDITLCKEDSLIIVEYAAGRITRVGLDGKLMGRFGTSGYGAGQMTTPWGLDVDDALRVLVADTGNRRLVEIQL